ncbi:uncharacterized protein [Parasteatoda tepidariorum]|uniref:uncharacterized protein n=1 Tax=Parasteatoda tepidariorum TaxID=114398 RepID=UPI00077FADCF|nr:uncharacterized protein LOC107446503 [Parasteatoda tepidariorum]
MNFTGLIITVHRLITILIIIICIHGGGGGFMHKMKMMKMMKEHQENQHKGITIGIKAIKVPIPIPIAMPYVENQMMMKGHNKGMQKKKMKGQMMMQMMDKMMKMKMMKMMMKMHMKQMKMKPNKCKPKCMMMKMMKAKCEQECPETPCPVMMDNSCDSCPAMKSGWPSTGMMMMDNGWPAPEMMMNGWPSPMMMNNGWPSPMMKGMMKAMCPECPPCDDERPEVMEPDYYDEELEEDMNAWDTNPEPVYQKMDSDVKMKGDNLDEAIFYKFDKHLHINAFKLPLRQGSKHSDYDKRMVYDFDY